MAGHYDYAIAGQIAATRPPFDALIMAAALVNPDTANLVRLRTVFPEIVDETQARYNAPGGKLPADAR